MPETEEPTATEIELVEATATEAQVGVQSAAAPQSTPLAVVAEAPLINSPSIIFIEMMDKSYGWGITETEVVSTNDGGVTWYNVTHPV